MNKTTVITVVFAVCGLLVASLAFVWGRSTRPTAGTPVVAPQANPQAKDPAAAIGIRAVVSVRVESKNGAYNIVPVIQFANSSDQLIKLANGDFELTLRGRKKATGAAKEKSKEETKVVALGKVTFADIELPTSQGVEGASPTSLELRIPAGPKNDATAERVFEAVNLFTDPAWETSIEMKGTADTWGWTRNDENVEGWVHVGSRTVQLYFRPSMQRDVLLK